MRPNQCVTWLGLCIASGAALGTAGDIENAFQDTNAVHLQGQGNALEEELPWENIPFAVVSDVLTDEDADISLEGQDELWFQDDVQKAEALPVSASGHPFSTALSVAKEEGLGKVIRTREQPFRPDSQQHQQQSQVLPPPSLIERQVAAGLDPSSTAPAASSPSEKMFVFLFPPVSLVHSQLGIAFEMQRRGHRVMILTMEGLRKHYEQQAAIAAAAAAAANSNDAQQLKNTVRTHPIDFWVLETKEWDTTLFPTSRGDLIREDAGRPSKETVQMAFRAYDLAFRVLLQQIDQFRQSAELGLLNASDPRDSLILERLDRLGQTDKLLFIIPVTGLSAVQYCIDRRIPYVITIPTAMFARNLSSSSLFQYSSLSVRKAPGTIFERAKDAAINIKKAWDGDSMFGIDLSVLRTPASFKLVTSLPLLADVVPYSPATVFVGPIVSQERKSPKLLSPKISKLLNNPNNFPVIYISLGTYAQIDLELGEKITQAFIPPRKSFSSLESSLNENDTEGASAFDEEMRTAERASLDDGLQQTEIVKQWGVIWALPSEQFERLSNSTQQIIRQRSSVMVVEPWVATSAVLAHPNLKLFVSHCGANGLGEAVEAGVPVLGLPLFGDQPWNCAAGESNARSVVCKSLLRSDPRDLRKAALDILFGESSLPLKAQLLKGLVQRVYPGMRLAGDWLEVIHSLKGDATVMYSHQQLLGSFKENGLDVLLAVAVFGVLVAFFTGYITAKLIIAIRRCCRCCCGKSSRGRAGGHRRRDLQDVQQSLNNFAPLNQPAHKRIATGNSSWELSTPPTNFSGAAKRVHEKDE